MSFVIWNVTQRFLKYSNSRKRFHLFCRMRAIYSWRLFTMVWIFIVHSSSSVKIYRKIRLNSKISQVWGNYCTYYSQLKATREEYRFSDILCFLFSCQKELRNNDEWTTFFEKLRNIETFYKKLIIIFYIIK